MSSPESRCDALHHNPLDSNDLRAWRHLAYELEHQNDLAQTEIKGHMRVEDELKADLERAYQVLELHGVPRERAKSVANGIDVLASRFDKQNHFYEQALARENEAQSRIAELEKAIQRVVETDDFDDLELDDGLWTNSARRFLQSALKDRA